MEPISKRRKPLLIEPHSPDYVSIKKTPGLVANDLSGLSPPGEVSPKPLTSSFSSTKPSGLPSSFASIRQLSVSCFRTMTPTPQKFPDEAGRLTTVTSSGEIKILVIKLNEQPWRLGRNNQADLTIDKPTVSNWHCKVYAIECDTGERLVCLEDVSTNGIRHNGKLIRKKAVILNEGDHINIADQEFLYSHSAPPGRWQGQNASPKQGLPRFRPITLGKYCVTERVLGSGFFSIVHLAINTQTCAQLACKIVKRPLTTKRSYKEATKFQRVMQQEVELNASLEHPNINKIVALKQDSANIYLFLELVTGGDLFGYVTRNKHLQQDEAKFIFYQLALGLQYMHDVKKISHRDIKPENILLAHHGPEPRVLIADFGAARLADKAFCSMQGTMSYAAPEVLTVYTRQEGYDGKKADLWSLGVCLFMMLCGFHPFDKGELESRETERRKMCEVLHYHVEREEVQFVKSVLKSSCKDEALGYLSSDYAEVRDVLKRLLEEKPFQRISAQAVLAHPWIENSKTALEEKYQERVLGQTRRKKE
ncbi:hypothetical protein O181_087650 [Austropuccinia psidii MF-1]|uniref:non-specific serine/threonine protein kinase n=1 Tax=Austropuccinia psidii MF-1 TaxID=1389203 RepID=A0A9Q3IQ18_9BASI|nr:hypothetical protein [Austropuccinia psidii MF-1]